MTFRFLYFHIKISISQKGSSMGFDEKLRCQWIKSLNFWIVMCKFIITASI